MTTINFKDEHIFDFKGGYKLAKYPPKEEGYYMTIKCGLGGIYSCLNEWKNGKWECLALDDSTVIAYSKEQVPKEDVRNWLIAELEKYKNK
jgi:hypothetical protein